MPLGKSLDNLLTDYFGETQISLKDNLQLKQSGFVVEVPVEQVILSSYQTRTFFETEKIEALAENIQKQGVLQPVIVLQKKFLEEKNPQYILLAGERRLRAVKLLGLKTIPAIVKKEEEIEEKDQALISASENLQREDLSPLELAQTFKMLMLTQGYSLEKLAEKIKKTPQYLKNYLNLLTLGEKIQTALSQKELTEGQARHLVGLETSLQEEILSKIISEKLTVKEVMTLVKKKTTPIVKNFYTKKPIHNLPAEIIHKADRFASQFPCSKIKCSGDASKGKIIITWG